MFIIEKRQKVIQYLFEKKDYQTYLSNLSDGFYEITPKKIKKLRSLRQNRYYFGVVLKLLSDYTGYTPIELHDGFRAMFLKVPGEFIERVKSTTELDTSEFETYLAQIRVLSSEKIGINIPLPNETGGFNYDFQSEKTGKGDNDEF